MILLIIFSPLLYITMIQKAGMPVWTTIMLIIFSVMSIFYLLFKKKMQDKLLDYKGDVKQFVSNVKIVKRWHLRSILITTPVSVTFGAVLFVEYIKAVSKTMGVNQESLIAAIIAMIVLMVIDVYVDMRKSRILDNIIKEIEE